jgi:recombination protein RecA
VALDHKLIQKSGSYFSFGDERLGQGRTNVKAFLIEHTDVTDRLLDAIQTALPDAVIPRRTPPAEGPVKMPVSEGDAPSEDAASANGASLSSVE